VCSVSIRKIRRKRKRKRKRVEGWVSKRSDEGSRLKDQRDISAIPLKAYKHRYIDTSRYIDI